VVDTATVTFPDIADNFANDPLGANATPRIAAAGFRGFSYTSGFAVLQVDALQPADTAFTLRDCIVSFHPTPSPAPTFPPVVNRINGTNTWVAIVPLAGLNAGTYLLDVYVYAKNDATNQVTVSDHWPRIRVH
jgi:hypothetical protein